MKHIKKTYTKFNGGYVLENIETLNHLAYFNLTDLESYLAAPSTTFKGGFIITVNNGGKMTKNIFLT